jgi:hypothetical protein
MATDTDELKLIALDADDLAVVSAHVQDSVAKLADMAFLKEHKRFAMLLNRFDWTGKEGAAERRRAAIRFERVLGARTRGLDLSDRDAVVNLLAVEFEESNPPGGAVTLYFSGDAAIRLEVECLEAELTDLGPRWSARARPRHLGLKRGK